MKRCNAPIRAAAAAIVIVAWIITWLVSLAHGAGPGAGPVAPSPRLGAGVYERSQPITLARQVKLGVPAPYLATQPSYPADALRGDGINRTFLRFAPTISGAMIQTAGYGSGLVGATWNDNDTMRLPADANVRALLGASVSDITVDGRGELHSYPWDYNAWDSTRPDLHGPDAVSRCDGLHAEGGGFTGEHLRFFQIPGTAVVLRGGINRPAGYTGVLDSCLDRLSDTHVTLAINGYDLNCGDIKLDHLTATGIVKDGLTIRSTAEIVSDHIWGADRAAVFLAPVTGSHLYHEAARIGTEFGPGSDGSNIDGLTIGPGTCSKLGVNLLANGITITRLAGRVRTGATGVIAVGTCNHHLQGDLVLDEGATGVSFTGVSTSTLDLKGGWNVAGERTLVKLRGRCVGLTITVHGVGDGGTVVDASEAELIDCDLNIKWDGTAERLKGKQ